MLINYILTIDEPTYLICDMCNFISKYKQQRICKLMLKARDITVCQMILGELLLKYVLVKHYKIKLKDILIKLGNNGKPYLDGSNINFNISHSGNKVMCSCSDAPIGIDIQRVNKNAQVDQWSFSAKEAFGKKSGVGFYCGEVKIKRKCAMGKRYAEINSNGEKKLIYQNLYKKNYIVSISSDALIDSKNDFIMQEIKCADLLNVIKGCENNE
jgi:light-regulated signal transduction histidine kinase (bacteriophytochrome)